MHISPLANLISEAAPEIAINSILSDPKALMDFETMFSTVPGVHSGSEIGKADQTEPERSSTEISGEREGSDHDAETDTGDIVNFQPHTEPVMPNVPVTPNVNDLANRVRLIAQPAADRSETLLVGKAPSPMGPGDVELISDARVGVPAKQSPEMPAGQPQDYQRAATKTASPYPSPTTGTAPNADAEEVVHFPPEIADAASKSGVRSALADQGTDQTPIFGAVNGKTRDPHEGAIFSTAKTHRDFVVSSPSSQRKSPDFVPLTRAVGPVRSMGQPLVHHTAKSAAAPAGEIKPQIMMAQADSTRAHIPVEIASANPIKASLRFPETQPVNAQTSLPVKELANSTVPVLRNPAEVNSGIGATLHRHDLPMQEPSLPPVRHTANVLPVTSAVQERTIFADPISSLPPISEFCEIQPAGMEGPQPARGVDPASVASVRAAKRVATQLVEGAQKSQNGMIELTLHPRELGRVQMQMLLTEAGLNVVIHAERAETLDLMRRHADILVREFTNIGNSNISFSFRDRDQDASLTLNREEQHSPDAAADDPCADTEAIIVVQTLRLDASGLDIRL